MIEKSRGFGRWVALAAALAFSGGLPGCAIVDNLDDGKGGIRVQATGVEVLIQNGLDERVYYFVVGRQLSFLIDWIPHLDDERSVAPGRTKSVRYVDIMMSQDPVETQIVVYWWEAAEKDGKRVPGDVNTVVLDLP